MPRFWKENIFWKMEKKLFQASNVLYSRIDANKKLLFVGAVHCYFPARNNTHTIYIYTIHLLLLVEGNNWHTQGREGWVAPAAEHARKRSEKPVHIFGCPCLRSTSLDPRLLLLKRKMLFFSFSFISFHSFSQRKAAIICSRIDANKKQFFAGAVHCYFLQEGKEQRMDMPDVARGFKKPNCTLILHFFNKLLKTQVISKKISFTATGTVTIFFLLLNKHLSFTTLSFITFYLIPHLLQRLLLKSLVTVH